MAEQGCRGVTAAEQTQQSKPEQHPLYSLGGKRPLQWPLCFSPLPVPLCSRCSSGQDATAKVRGAARGRGARARGRGPVSCFACTAGDSCTLRRLPGHRPPAARDGTEGRPSAGLWASPAPTRRGHGAFVWGLVASVWGVHGAVTPLLLLLLLHQQLLQS